MNAMIIFGAVLTLYVFWRGIMPLKIKRIWKTGLLLVLAAVAFKFYLLGLIGGPMFFAPDLPKSFLMITTWLFATLFIFFFLLLAANILNGCCHLLRLCFRRRGKAKFPFASNHVNLVLLILSLILATFGIINGTSVPNVREETVFLKHLPLEAEGMTIAVLADLHADSITRADRIQSIVDRANACKPDLTVIVGDFVDGPVNIRGRDLLPLQNLSARYGVYGVPGNHEYYSGYDQWMDFLSCLGIKMLPNEHVLVGTGKAGIVLAGVTDPTAGRTGHPQPSIEQALNDAPHYMTRILLSHQPRLAPEASRNGVDLQISGHTHGGMIVGVNRIVAGFNAGYVSGSYHVGDMVLFISNGSGIWNGFPIRLGVPSEIVILRLKKA